MRLVFALALALVATAHAASLLDKQKLPKGYTSASQLVNVLASEPSKASGVSFASSGSGGGSVSFSSSSRSSSGSGGKPHNAEVDEIHAEYDGQIEDIKKNMKKMTAAIKETEKCAQRLNEQRAQLRSLVEQKEHLEKEREKAILQAKLRKQMADLSEINHMSRTLRSKFSELKRTQQLIKTRMEGTRTSINQLDNDPGVDTGSLKDSANSLTSDVDRMHHAESKILSASHHANDKRLRATLHSTNKAQGSIEKKAEKTAKKLASSIQRSV